jgi:tetratricopeptide (TPR) repeat protein
VVPHDPSSFRDEPEFTFRHALIRDGAYDSLPKALRADKHLGVARWAADRAGDRVDEIAELIATHETEAIRYLDELGERRPDIERVAYEHAWAAARRTSALGLGAESTRWYRAAEGLADRLDIPRPLRTQLFREHAAESWGRDPVAETERVVRRAIEAFTAVHDDRGIAWATGRLVIPLMQQSRHDEAEAAGRSAVEALEPLGDSEELADALHRLGWFLWRRGANAEAEPLLRRALDMAKDLGNVLVLAEATQTLAVCLPALGKVREGHILMEEAFRLAKEAGDYQNLMRAYNNIAHARAATQGPKATADVEREGLELALRSGTIANGGWIAGTLGDMEQLIGELADAEEHQRLAVSLAQRVGDEPLTGQRLSSLAMVLLMRGRAEEALAVRDQAVPLIDANPEPQAAAFLPSFDGYAALARADRAEAADHFANAVDLLRAFEPENAPDIFAECVRALVRLGNRERAETYRDLDGPTDSVQTPVFAMNVRGLLERDPGRAIDILRETITEFQRLEMDLYVARASVDLAHVVATADLPGHGPQEVRELLDRARDILLECDARLFLFEVDEVMAGLPDNLRDTVAT